jgi:hypothetical protein
MLFFSYEGQNCEGKSLTNKNAASYCSLLQLTVKQLRGKQQFVWHRQADVMLVEFLARTELHSLVHSAISLGLESVIWAINICGRTFCLLNYLELRATFR